MIVDTSVLLDIFLATRSRHAEAIKFARFLRARQVRVVVPMFALFEIAAATRQEKITIGGGKLSYIAEFTEADGLQVFPAAIDEAFLNKYMVHDLPYMKAGDFIFVAMAKVDGDVLITEDDKQLARAREGGVEAYRIAEYLAQQGAA